MKTWALLCLLLLISGCGKKQGVHAPWPASIKISGLTQTETQAVKDKLDSFNSTFGGEVFYFDDKPSHFQITVGKLSPSGETSSKAGLATYDESFCKVELNDVVFSESYSSFLEPVLWHELGHCAGMEHDSKLGELMYYTASPWNFYSTDAITRFMNAFSNLTALIKK